MGSFWEELLQIFLFISLPKYEIWKPSSFFMQISDFRGDDDVRSHVRTGCKGSWQMCCFSLFKEGEGKIVTYTFFLSHFIAFPCLDFCSVNSITCTLKVTVLPVIALAVATNLFLYSNYAQSMKGIRCDWGQQVVVVDSNSQCALLQSWKLSFPIKPSRIWKLLNGEYILQRYPYIFRQT